MTAESTEQTILFQRSGLSNWRAINVVYKPGEIIVCFDSVSSYPSSVHAITDQLARSGLSVSHPTTDTAIDALHERGFRIINDAFYAADIISMDNPDYNAPFDKLRTVLEALSSDAIGDLQFIKPHEISSVVASVRAAHKSTLGHGTNTSLEAQSAPPR